MMHETSVIKQNKSLASSACPALSLSLSLMKEQTNE